MLGIAAWREVGDPLLVLAWPWRFFCGVWMLYLQWSAQERIDEQQREIERERQRLAQEARANASGW